MSRVWIIFILLLAIELIIAGYLLFSLRAVHRAAPSAERRGRFRDAIRDLSLYTALLRGRQAEFAKRLAPIDAARFSELRTTAAIFAAILLFDVIYDVIHAFYGL